MRNELSLTQRKEDEEEEEVEEVEVRLKQAPRGHRADGQTFRAL